MGEDREGHRVWYDNFNYDFKGVSPTIDNVLSTSFAQGCITL